MQSKGVSVIICCFNGASRLPQTIRYLSKQQLPPNIPWEVIVVDNNSSDLTASVARDEWNSYNLEIPFCVLHESRPGLSFARDLGLRTARFEYVLFCDDDNWLDSNFLAIAFSVMESNPKIGALGGQGIAVTDGDLPEWFKEFEICYAVGKQAEKSGDVSTRGFLWGAGLVLRHSIWQKLRHSGVRSLLSGRTGNDLSAGDDSEICKWILLQGYQLWYEERLVFRHYLPQSRLNIEYRESMIAGFNRAEPILSTYQLLINEQRLFQMGLLRYPVGCYYLIAALLSRVSKPQISEQRLNRAQILLGRYLRLVPLLQDILLMHSGAGIVDGSRSSV